MLPSVVKKISLVALILVSLTGCSITHAMRVENREMVDIETMIDEIEDTPLIFIGERHDAPQHHRLQLQVVKELHGRGKAVTLAMEMFESPSQDMLDAWVAGKIPTEGLKRLYQWSWRNIPWELYEDIFLYARDNKIPILALNAPRQIVHKVAQLGMSSLSQEELRLLPPGVTGEVSDDYLNLIRSSYPVHGDNFRYICEAQAIRNRTMAALIKSYRTNFPQATVVVIAGGGHARERGGVPVELGSLPRKVILPPVPGLTADVVTREDGDYLLEESPDWWEAL